MQINNDWPSEGFLNVLGAFPNQEPPDPSWDGETMSSGGKVPSWIKSLPPRSEGFPWAALKWEYVPLRNLTSTTLSYENLTHFPGKQNLRLDWTRQRGDFWRFPGKFFFLSVRQIAKITTGSLFHFTKNGWKTPSLLKTEHDPEPFGRLRSLYIVHIVYNT